MKARINTKGLAGALADLRGLSGGAMREALADALNHTANQARKALRVEMNDIFEQPSPWVLDSIFMQNAKPQRLESALWVKENKVGGTGKGFDDWLAPQVFGGVRLHKGSEKLLREAGILPAGRFIMPGAAARLDADGNISRGQMVQIVSGLKAFRGKSARMNATSSRRSQQKGNATAFFVMYRGKTPVGVAERRGSQMGIVLAFVSQPRYRQRLRFHEVVQQVAAAQLASNVDRAIAQVMSRRR